MHRAITMMDEIDDPNPNNKKLYENEFEKQFLEDTTEFYKQISLQLLSNNSAANYISLLNERYTQEKSRADSYLKPQTKEKLISTFIDEAISKHANQILDKETGLFYMLENDRMQELTLMFELFKLREDSMNCFQKKIG